MDYSRDPLNNSIKNCLVSDVEVSTLMSGGLDSTMTAIASKLHPNITAYTLSWDKDISPDSELHNAKKIAEENNIFHKVSNISHESLSAKIS